MSAECQSQCSSGLHRACERMGELHLLARSLGVSPLELAIVLSVALRSLLANEEWAKSWEVFGQAGDIICSNRPITRGADIAPHLCDCLAKTVAELLGPLGEPVEPDAPVMND
jgi:hypothetical protein